jgi:hypothetical protein
MRRIICTLMLMGVVCLGLAAQAGDFPGENLIEVKLTLPKGDTYVRGATDPVADLFADIVLTNISKKENLGKESKPVTNVVRLTYDEANKLADMTKEEREALVESKKKNETIEQRPVNEASFGVAYVEPQLGPHDVIDFYITRKPEEGEPALPDNAKPVYILRDNKADSVARVDISPLKYLAAGESSPAFSLPVGKYYLIRDPGLYTMKAVIKTVGNTAAPLKFAESNEVQFRVVPFKMVDQKIGELQRDWDNYERGIPSFPYHIYEVQTEDGNDEVFWVQRIMVRGIAQWEWQRLCTVKAGTQAQIAQIGPKKFAVLAVHRKGNAGLYTLDFATTGPGITAKSIDVKEGTMPKLKVEAGAATVE